MGSFCKMGSLFLENGFTFFRKWVHFFAKNGFKFNDRFKFYNLQTIELSKILRKAIIANSQINWNLTASHRIFEILAF